MKSTKITRPLKSLYLALPLKNLFIFVRRFVKLPKKIYWYLRFRGNFTVHVDERRSFKIRHHGFSMENSIFWTGLTGEYESVSFKLWILLSKKADVVLDIGANTGIYSLIAKTVNANNDVYAFEPIPRTFKKLQYNNSLNNYNISCLEMAASNSDGTAEINDWPDDNPYSATISKDFKPSNSKPIPLTIKTIRIDSFIRERNILKIDLVKLDVETYEAEVLQGFGVYLEKFRPTFLIEILNDHLGKQIEDIFKDKNYLYFNIDDEAGSIQMVRHVSKSDSYNYLFCSEEVAKALQLI